MPLSCAAKDGQELPEDNVDKRQKASELKVISL
jgi:hypothetical protein